MRVTKTRSLLCMIAALLLAYGCNNDDDSNVQKLDPEVVSLVVTTVAAQNSIHQMIGRSNNALGSVSFAKNAPMETSCPTISIVPGEQVDSLILDYGTEFCASQGGVLYKGRMILVLSMEQSQDVQLIMEDFCMKDFCMSGTLQWTFNEGSEGSEFSMVVQDWIVEDNQGGTQIINMDMQYQLVEGSDTTDPSDDVYEVSGSSSGVTPDGVNYSMTIAEPLVFSLDCQWITKGVVIFEMDQLPITTIDYGDGTCDQEVVVTIEGIDQQVSL